MFDGFLSDLPIPTQKVAADSDLEMSVPLMAWLDENYKQELNPDTIINESLYKLTKYYETGKTLTIRNSDYSYKVTLEMQDVRIEDVYNLLLSLVARREDRSIMLENSTFIAHKTEGINKIKIQGYYPVVITKSDENNIKVEITSFELGC